MNYRSVLCSFGIFSKDDELDLPSLFWKVSLNFTFWYIDDILLLNNQNLVLMLNSFVLSLDKEYRTDTVQSFHLFTFTVYEKRDYFSFPIVNIPFLRRTFLQLLHMVYISTLDTIFQGLCFLSLYLGLLLTRKLLNQEFEIVKLKFSSFRNFFRTPSRVGWPLWNINFTYDCGYVSNIVTTTPSFVPEIQSTVLDLCTYMSNTTGATWKAGSAYPSETPEIITIFLGSSYCSVFSLLWCVLCTIVCLFVFSDLAIVFQFLFSTHEFECLFCISLAPPSVLVHCHKLKISECDQC